MSERRLEPRFCADQEVVVSVLSPIRGVIENASKSGFRITTQVAIKKGVVIEIKWDRAAVIGTVRYCRKAAGKYNIGLKVTEVIGFGKVRTRAEAPDCLAS
jgi:hypothetical protein